jgi:hypothetical protein
MPHNGRFLGVHSPTPCTQNQLAKMERQWAILADSATTMLQHANCPTKYWGLAMHTAVYLHNRLPSPAASAWSGGVPYTILHGVPVDLAHRKVFGRTAYLRLEDRFMDKLSPKALRCMFIGYCDDGPRYLNGTRPMGITYGDPSQDNGCSQTQTDGRHTRPPRDHNLGSMSCLMEEQ